MWSRYEIFLYNYGESRIIEHDPKTTALVGFSAGGLDVLKHYSNEYALIALLDPSTHQEHELIQYGENVCMIYNQSNWGSMNRSISKIADRIKKNQGYVESVNLAHGKIPSYFFNQIFKGGEQ